MTKEEKKRKAHLITLVLIALYLSLLETLIPKPFPWMKIGLANLSTLIAFIKFDRRMGIDVFLLRAVAQSIMLGTMLTPSFAISFGAGLASTLLMALLFSYRKLFSTLAISTASGILHNCVQLIIVYFLLFRGIDIYTKSMMWFISVFLFAGGVSGVIIGYIAYRYVEKDEEFGGLDNGKKIFWNRWNKRGSK